MTKQNKCLIDYKEWQALSQHHAAIAPVHLRELFLTDPERFSRFSLSNGEIFLDYSRNRINAETMQRLCQLATATGLPGKIAGLFAGETVNVTENRAVMHTALRHQGAAPLYIKGENISVLIAATLTRMRSFVAQIHAQAWRGVTGKPIRHVVTIGVGGSYLGVMMACQALKDFACGTIDFHFISSIDQAMVQDVLAQVDLEATLFIVSSKTFTTMETITNAQALLNQAQAKMGMDVVRHHFVAITACAEKARAFGIPEENIFPIWDWVGGRYSVWSAIGLPLMLQIGCDAFADFLAGAFALDQHFRHAELAQNMPVILALLTLWYTNFFHTSAQAVVPYSHRLRHFVAYLQQTDMESNGKCIDLDGRPIAYATGPVIFGEEGCNGQHSYHQLLHQGRHLIPTDFIVVGHAGAERQDHHQDILIASAFSQAQALMLGKSFAEVRDAHDYLALHQTNPGNRPSNVIILERLTPKNLGALLALYEHKIFTLGAIWNINSFDQWGVELGKQLLPNILRQVQGEVLVECLDAATMGVIEHVKQIQGRS